MLARRRKRTAYQTFFGLLAVVATPSAGAADDAVARPFTIKSPPGFEAEADEQTTVVDIYYVGRKIGATAARFNSATISFLDPEGTAALVPDARNYAAIASALSSPLDAHRNMSCDAETPVADCGYVDPDPVAVILTTARLKADIFVSDALTYSRDERARFLPPPTLAPAMIAGISGRSFVDFDTGDLSGSGELRVAAGAGRNSVEADMFASTNGEPSLRSAFFQRVGRDRELVGGYVQSAGDWNVARSSRLVGVRYGTTLKTRIDPARLGATDIPVSVSSGATVEILRDGEVIDIQRIEPGQTRIDPSRLPGGSYPLTLRIAEGDTTRDQTIFFMSGSQLPPRDAPQWYVEAGYLAPTVSGTSFAPNVGDTVALNAGASARISASAGVAADLSIGKRDRFAEASLFSAGRGRLATIGGLISGDGDWGVFGNASLFADRWRVAGSLRMLEAADESRFDRFAPFDPLPESFRQAQADASVRIPRGSVGARGFYRRSTFGGESWFAGPYADIRLAKLARADIAVSAHYQFGDDRDTAFASLRLSAPLDFRRSSLSAQASFRREALDGGDTRINEVLDVAWQSAAVAGHPLSPQLTLGARYEDGEVGGRAGARAETPFASAGIDARGNYQNQNNLLLDGSTAVAITRDGVGFGARYSRTGALVKLAGASDAEIDVTADGLTRASARPGGTRFIGTPDFAMIDVAIRARQSGDVDYPSHADRLVLFPGNVPVVSRRVWRVTIMVGRLVDASGAPMPNLRLRTGEFLGATDEAGYFQIDYDGGQLTAEPLEGAPCVVETPTEIAAAGPYLDADDIVCRFDGDGQPR